MKLIILIAICTICLVNNSKSQPCTSGRIQTAVVERPTEAVSIAVTCDVIQLSWKGVKHQNYIITAACTDASGKTTEVDAGAITYDKESNCLVLLPVKQGSTITWSIQAVEKIDGRTFYSYPLRGESTGCEKKLIVESEKSAQLPTAKPGINADKDALKQELTVYPNPVSGELTIQWTSDYKGSAKLTITDASGKPVRSMPVTKAQLNYSDKLSVSAFSAGLYYLYINMQNGKSVSTKFIKK